MGKPGDTGLGIHVRPQPRAWHTLSTHFLTLHVGVPLYLERLLWHQQGCEEGSPRNPKQVPTSRPCSDRAEQGSQQKGLSHSPLPSDTPVHLVHLSPVVMHIQDTLRQAYLRIWSQNT